MSTTSFALLLTPIFSKYQVLESAYVQTYFANSLAVADSSKKYYILSLITDTPYLFYLTYALYNPTRTVLLSGEPLGVQQTIISLAFTAVVMSHLNNSSIVMVNGNGPVVNSGFTSMMTLASSLGKPVVYWKDDVRHLWGFNDNPLAIGTIPCFSKHLYEPSTLPIRLNLYDPTKKDDCGEPVFPQLIKDALNNTPQSQAVVTSTYIQNMIKLGEALNVAFGPGNAITWSAVLKDPLATYKAIKSVVVENINLLSPCDQSYIKGVQYLTSSGRRQEIPNMALRGLLSGWYKSAPPNQFTQEIVDAYQQVVSIAHKV